MKNDELDELAARLWARHRDALQFLVDHRPDVLGPLFESFHKDAQQIAARVSTACKSVIEVDSETRAYIRFAVSEWDKLPGFRDGEGWTASGRLILVELSKSETEVKVSAILGPGPEQIRERLFEAIQKSDIRAPGSLAKKYKWLRSRVLLRPTDPDGIDVDDQRERVLVDLEGFFRELVPRFTAALANLKI